MNIPVNQLIPLSPLHWTSILHYGVLLVTLYMLVTSGDKTPLLYIIILGVEALLVGADLYIDKVAVTGIFIFLIRTVMTAVPIVMAGWSPTETARSAGIVAAILAIPILVLTFFSCNLGALGDPRIFALGWCAATQ